MRYQGNTICGEREGSVRDLEQAVCQDARGLSTGCGWADTMARVFTVDILEAIAQLSKGGRSQQQRTPSEEERS